MKKTKQLLVLLLAVMLVVGNIVPVNAATTYASVSPSQATIDVAHTMTLTDAQKTLSYPISYSLEVKDGVTGPDGTNVSVAVTGKPSITSAINIPVGNYTSTSGVISNTLTIDWTGVSFKEPGVYKWQVEKKITAKGPETLSNDGGTSYVYAYVVDNGGTLSVEQVGMAVDEALTVKRNLADTYPASAHDLTVEKIIQGNEASKNQYFKLLVTLRLPDGASGNYNIKAASGSTYDTSVPETAYHLAQTNPIKTGDLTGGTPKEIAVWLKGGQKIIFEALPHETIYSVTEDADTAKGYTMTGSVSGKTLDLDRTVDIVNTKTATTPTGIILQAAAPVAGIVLALALLAVVMLSKKRSAARR